MSYDTICAISKQSIYDGEDVVVIPITRSFLLSQFFNIKKYDDTEQKMYSYYNERFGMSLGYFIAKYDGYGGYKDYDKNQFFIKAFEYSFKEDFDSFLYLITKPITRKIINNKKIVLEYSEDFYDFFINNTTTITIKKSVLDNIDLVVFYDKSNKTEILSSFEDTMVAINDLRNDFDGNVVNLPKIIRQLDTSKFSSPMTYSKVLMASKQILDTVGSGTYVLNYLFNNPDVLDFDTEILNYMKLNQLFFLTSTMLQPNINPMYDHDNVYKALNKLNKKIQN